MSEQVNNSVSLDEVELEPQQKYGDLSLESLVMLINTERLKSIEEKSHDELLELKTRQEKVRKLHNLSKAINKNTNEKGELDISKDLELQQMLKDAEELGIEVKEGKLKFKKEERDRLVENIRMTTEDYNTLNEMQLQTLSRLNSERYESYQLARLTMKTHDDTMKKIAGGIVGR